MRMFIATWRTFWNSRTVIEITLKLANLRKRRAQNWARQTAPVLVPRKCGTKMHKSELERGFDNQPAFSKHVLQVPKTIPMATVTMRMFIATWRTFWNSRTVIEITLKLANLRKRRAQNWARQTAPVLVPRKWRGTKTGAVWRTRFWARLLHKIVSLSVVSITSPPFQNTFFKFQKPSPWQQGR